MGRQLIWCGIVLGRAFAGCTPAHRIEAMWHDLAMLGQNNISEGYVMWFVLKVVKVVVRCRIELVQ